MKHFNTTHGFTRTKEYRAWSHAKGRCYNPNDTRYRIYGALGVRMCEEWKDNFAAFISDMGKAPTPHHTLERKDRKGNYEPSNCVWATRIVQANNTCANRMVEYEGSVLTAAQLASNLGLKYKSFWHYLETRGLPLSVAIAKSTQIGEKRKSGERRFYTHPKFVAFNK